MPHNRKLYIETVGCQMNMLDSELVVAALRKDGFELTSDMHAADTVLFNTCSVRDHAEHKIYSQLGRLRHSKKRRPDQVIGVIGCMAQKDQEVVFQRAPHVDLVVGTGQLAEIPRMIAEARAERKHALAVSLDRKEGTRLEVAESFQSYDPLREPEMRPSPYQAFVRIMIGCDKFCTYCVVPMTRGPEQSRPPSLIARECRVLADQGVKEVTLIGQTVNSYKHTENGRLYRLSDLLETIHDTAGILRIKFVTNFPKDMTNDLLQAVRDLPKVASYLHVPAQSGCNEVLRRMKRGYTVEDYREMLGRIREILPQAAVSSDFIVGHPGETEKSFEKSLDLIRECRFKNSFIFKYSPRPGTKGFDLYADDIPEDVKRRRNHAMLALQNEISEEDNVTFIGRQVEVLVEGLSKRGGRGSGTGGRGGFDGERGRAGEGAPEWHDENTFSRGPTDRALAARLPLLDSRPETIDRDPTGRAHSQASSPSTLNLQPSTSPLQLTGRTPCDRIVVFDGNPRLAGTIARVEIHDCTPTTLIGAIVTREVQHGSHPLLPILA